jgi:hypothetical protein
LNRKLSAIISFIAALLVAVSLIVSEVPAAQAADDPCAAQIASLGQVQSQISAHNAEPHTFTVPKEQAALDAYDAEAAQLNAAQASDVTALENCEVTLGVLAGRGPNSLPLKRPTNQIRNNIGQLKAELPADVQQYKNPGSAGYWRVPPDLGPLYDALRQNNPGNIIGSPYLQGQPRPSVGDPDPAYPNDIIPSVEGNPNIPAVSADHIVSLAEIMNLPGFTELSPENMYIITRAPLNFQWLSQAANLAKSSREVAFMEDADPTWVEEQQVLHDTVRTQLEDIIQKLVANQ